MEETRDTKRALKILLWSAQSPGSRSGCIAAAEEQSEKSLESNQHQRDVKPELQVVLNEVPLCYIRKPFDSVPRRIRIILRRVT